MIKVESERMAVTAGFVDPDSAYVWAWNWSEPQDEALIVEGAFDGMSLCHCGITALAVSNAVITVAQAAMIRKYLKVKTLVIATDNDAAAKAVKINNAKLLQRRGWRVKMVAPPPDYKDWNEAWHAWRDPYAIQSWVAHNSEPLTMAMQLNKQLANAIKF